MTNDRQRNDEKEFRKLNLNGREICEGHKKKG